MTRMITIWIYTRFLYINKNDIDNLDVTFTIAEPDDVPVPDTADVPDTGANFIAHDSSANASSLIIISSVLASICLLGCIILKRQNI